MLTLAQSVVQAIFLAMPVNVVGTAWMNYTLCICPLVFSIVLFFLKIEYTRQSIDLLHSTDKNTNNISSNSSGTVFDGRHTTDVDYSITVDG